MPLYRKKSVIVHAEQWFPDNLIKGVSILMWKTENGAIVKSPYGTILNQKDGTKISVYPGDWVITDERGFAISVYQPESFEDAYDLVENQKDTHP